MRTILDFGKYFRISNDLLNPFHSSELQRKMLAKTLNCVAKRMCLVSSSWVSAASAELSGIRFA